MNVRHFVIRAINQKDFWECDIRECNIAENYKSILTFQKEKGLVVDGKINTSYQLSAFGILRLVHQLGDENYKGKVIVYVKQDIIVDNKYKNWDQKELERSIQAWNMVSPRLLRWIYLGRAFLVANQKGIDLEIRHIKQLK